MSERDVIERTERPNTIDSLSAELRALGIAPGMVLLVHSSLSAIGWVCGGAVAVIQALECVLGPEGTLVMPTMSGDLTDPRDWQHPPVPEAWKDTIRASAPAFDRNLTPTRMMGAIAETFRTAPSVLRSDHPHCSFAAQGPHAREITAGHQLDYGMGEGSPLARVYELDGWVLLLGVGHANNSSLHLAEYRTEFPGKQEEVNGAPLLVDGERRWVQVRDLSFDESDFEAIGAAFESETDRVQIGRIGLAESHLMRQRELVDFACRWMGAHRTAG